MKKKTNLAINSDALANLKTMINPTLEILNLEVKNKWLVASLSSGIYFSVPNKSFKLKIRETVL